MTPLRRAWGLAIGLRGESFEAPGSQPVRRAALLWGETVGYASPRTASAQLFGVSYRRTLSSRRLLP